LSEIVFLSTNICNKYAVAANNTKYFRPRYEYIRLIKICRLVYNIIKIKIFFQQRRLRLNREKLRMKFKVDSESIASTSITDAVVHQIVRSHVTSI